MQTIIGSPPDSAGALYVKTPISPEEIFRAIGRLRKEARDEIDRLIRFLDESDNHMELEDGGDDEPSEDGEPSLGWTEGKQSCGCCTNASDVDLEGDDTAFGDCDIEPSLGSGATGEMSSQGNWATPGTSDLEDEHDGAEPDEADNEISAGFDTGEPSLGWGPDGELGNDSGSDRELQCHRSLRPRERIGSAGVTAEWRGYGEWRDLKGLSTVQAARMESVIRDYHISIL